MRLYTLLVRFLRLVSRLYFVEVHATGLHRVPARGPVILAANHPSSLLDPILLGTQAPRPIHYLARSGLFRWPVLAALFRRLGAIPVHRPGESTDHARRNEAAFARVHELLEHGGCVGIFPEGRNSPGGRVAGLRTGAARMALGAEARNDQRLGLVIVPVGIAYESRELLMSAVLLRFGAPIRVADYAELHATQPEAAVERLTADLQQALRRQALHVEDQRVAALATDLAAVLGEQLADDRAAEDEAAPEAQPARLKQWLLALHAWYRRGNPGTARALERRMHGRERINDVLARASVAEPRALATLRRQIDRYKDHLGQARLSRELAASVDEPAAHGRWPRLRMTVYALAMAPVAAFGAAHNAVPYALTWWGARLFSDDALRAFAGFGIGVAAFGAAYAGFGIWLWHGAGAPLAWTLAYVASLPPTGLAALTYRRSILVHRHRILVRRLLWNQRDLVELLRHERRVILARFRVLARRHPR